MNGLSWSDLRYTKSPKIKEYQQATSKLHRNSLLPSLSLSLSLSLLFLTQPEVVIVDAILLIVGTVGFSVTEECPHILQEMGEREDYRSPSTIQIDLKI